MPHLLEIKNLQVAVEGKEIIHSLNLTVEAGEVHALMGPNGSGKSTLAQVIAGHPAYHVTQGNIILDGFDITASKPEERARRGLFLAFQYPQAIAGLSVEHFLRMAYNAQAEARGDKPATVVKFRERLNRELQALRFKPDFLERSLNDGFSGGEKKRLEVLQLAVLQPKLAILDETDSGLDIDALRLVAEAIQHLVGPELGVLVITHYQRLLYYLKPTHVHLLVGGALVAAGGKELVEQVERHGYRAYIPTHATA